MRKKLGILLMCCAIILNGLQLAPTEAYAWTLNADTHFSTGFDSHDSSTMEMATWSNGGMFNCTWTTGSIAFQDGIMSLKIDSDGNGGYTGGEYRTQEAFGYGMFSVNMKPIKNPGVVTSFFTYTGPTDGTVWDEIDIEFLGYDTTKVQFNYFTNGVGNHEYLYDLGFDASEGFHTYGFYWGEGVITWYVDGTPVYTATENIPTTPGRIMMNAWPGTGVDDWLQPYNGETPLYGYYDWMAYDAPQDSSTSSTEVSFDGNQVYSIISKNSGKSLDVYYGNSDNGTNILQYTYNGYNNQKWYLQKQSNGYYIIRSYATGKVLDVADWSTSNGGNVHQWEYVGGANQEWSIEYVDGYYKIINRHSGLALDVSDVSTADNANVHQWEYVGGANQLWSIHPV